MVVSSSTRSFHSVVNQEACVVSDISVFSPGRIRVHGVYWFARLADGLSGIIPKDSVVIVSARKGNMLMVQPKLKNSADEFYSCLFPTPVPR